VRVHPRGNFAVVHEFLLTGRFCRYPSPALTPYLIAHRPICLPLYPHCHRPTAGL